MKKRCFVGLGGAGKNSLKPFLEKEKNAKYLVIDNETYEDYHCEWINSENKQAIVQYFEKDYDFIFLLGLSYSETKEKTGVKLMRLIGNLLKSQNRDFTMVLGLPFAFEYGIKRQQELKELRKELKSLAPNTIIVDTDKISKKYRNNGFSILSQFHYLTWKKAKPSYWRNLIAWLGKVFKIN